VLHVGAVGESVEWNIRIEVGEASGSGEFESDEGLADFVDETGGLNRHQKREVPSVLLTPEDHPMSLHCPSVVSFQFLSRLWPRNNRLALLDVTAHGMAAKIYHLPSIESRTRCLNGCLDALESYQQPILGSFPQGPLVDRPFSRGTICHH